MESQPDVQLGKIFIVLSMGIMLFIIILVIVVYFNAKSEASDCDPQELDTEKSEQKSESPTPKMFIAFLVITAFAVSTMNLTYKVNYFKKKTDENFKTKNNKLYQLDNENADISLLAQVITEEIMKPSNVEEQKSKRSRLATQVFPERIW